MNSSSSHFEYCRKSVQTHDPDRYLVSLVARNSQALWAVFAFHYEIAKTRLVVSEPTLGLIRLQWWRDEIGKIYPPSPEATARQARADDFSSPVLAALAEIIRRYDLPQEFLDEMITAREIEVRGEQPEGVDGAMAFLDMTETPLCSLIDRISGQGEGADPLPVVALNYGLMDALRRADDKSLVGQNRAEFEAAFVYDVRCENKALRSMQALSEIWMKHLVRRKGVRPPPFLAFRVWTKSLWL